MKHCRFKRIFIFLSVVVFFCFRTAAGYSQDTSFESSTDQTTVALGSSLQLTLTVTGGRRSVSPPDLLDIDGFESRYLGPFISTTIINGKYSQIIAFRYELYSLKTGQFQIPAMNIILDGQSLTTKPITIKVTDTADASSSGQTSNSRPAALEDKIFVVMSVPKREVYLNERVPLSIKLFVNGLDVKNIQYPEIGHAGFSIDEYQKPKAYQQIRGGIRYRVWEFKTHVYPTRTGDLILGPAKQICNILFKKSRSRKRSGRFGSFFNDDFFDGFFDSYDTRAVTLESTDLMIKVLPFPGKRKPKDFSGAVGKFDFIVSVGPGEVKVGDPVTVRMRVSGEGNLKAVTMPSFHAVRGNLKVYDPQINEEEGAKVLEQVVIPVNDRVRELPEIRFSYLNVDTGRYQTITKGPFPLKVTAVDEGEELKVVGFGRTGESSLFRTEEELLGQGIIFIKDHPGRFQPVGFRLYKNFLFLLMVGSSIILGAVFWAIYRITHKIRTDVKFARRLKAPGHARKGLLKAKEYMIKGEQGYFYDTLFKTLQNYFGNKFHMAAGSITIETIKDVVQTKRMKALILENIKVVFDECEMVRYASARQDNEKMKASYHRAEKIIDFFERNW